MNRADGRGRWGMLLMALPLAALAVGPEPADPRGR